MYLNNKVLVVDNFYKDPDYIRGFALEQEFMPCSHPLLKGNWPGLRSQYLHILNEKITEEFQNNLMKNLLEGITTNYNCYFETNFQLCYETITDSWIHTDIAEWPITHVGVVYLHPTPQNNSGTNIYNLRTEYIDEFKIYAEKHNNLWTTLNRDEDRNEFERWFEPSLSIPNKYNRAVIYDPHTWHKSDKYFGNSIETGRLTQVFFANIQYS